MPKPDNAQKMYKCARCGHMFPVGPDGRATCPKCGHDCSPSKCQVVGASNEDY